MSPLCDPKSCFWDLMGVCGGFLKLSGLIKEESSLEDSDMLTHFLFASNTQANHPPNYSESSVLKSRDGS